MGFSTVILVLCIRQLSCPSHVIIINGTGVLASIFDMIEGLCLLTRADVSTCP